MYSAEFTDCHSQLKKLLAKVSSEGIFTDVGQHNLKEFEDFYKSYHSRLEQELIKPANSVPNFRGNLGLAQENITETKQYVDKFCTKFYHRKQDDLVFAQDYGRLISGVYNLIRRMESLEKYLVEENILRGYNVKAV